MSSQRDFYIEECKSVASKYFLENQLIVNYIRERKMKPKQHINFPEGQVKAIQTFLNVTGGTMTTAQSIRILNMILPEDQKLSLDTREEKIRSFQAFESIYLHWSAKRSPIKGVVVAFTTTDADGNASKRVGWSLCNDGDTFNRFIGIRKAINAADDIDVVQKMAIEMYVPHRVYDVLKNVIDRANYRATVE